VAQAVTEASGPYSTVIDCAASPEIVEELLSKLVSHGTYVSVGYTRVNDFNLALVSHKELAICGIRSGRRSDLEEILRLVADGSIVAPTCDPWPLDEINRALAALRAGKVGGKVVIRAQM
jgi:D-arabinose 1-dehydrogenase-like Zn-dependent alcohol dehydrogenase